ncbi:MAG: potassium channel protein [Candidatus Riflebacteria bacterium]|nr:potassium channel protein [Candidatus Riflebacteria bacterium]
MKNKIFIPLVLFVCLVLFGTIGYRIIEGNDWSYFDGLYMTLITITTVGFGETHPLSTSGRILTLFLLLSGCGLMAFTLSAVVQFILEGKVQELWGRKRMKHQIKSMGNHYIICGAGDTGRAVISELFRKAMPFVVIDSDPKVCEELMESSIPAIEGDATVEEVLLEAGLKKAIGLVTALPHDADNVFVALTARGISPDIFVASTTSKIESASKLKRAGANYVISPNVIAGARMAAVLVRPSVVDFLDATMAGEDHALQMEEIRVVASSLLTGKSIKDADIRKRSGAIIVSVRKDHARIINPEPSYVFESGDILIVLGDSEQIYKMCELAGSQT